MADLLDIAPSTSVEVVKIDGVRVPVRGISLDAIASIVGRFPALRSLINGGYGEDFLPRLVQTCGAAVGPIIAAGCGHLADEACERHAAKLLIEHQLKFLKAILGLTFPNGIGSFVQEVTSLVGAGEGAKIVKVRLRKSQLPSQPLSETGLPPIMQ